MKEILAKSFGCHLDSLANYIQSNYNWESPESGFAYYVFYRADNQPPFTLRPDSLIKKLEQKRLYEAPVLAAIGYELASGRAFDESFLEAWANGLNRLSTREVFPADRASFFYRPVELLGISLGASYNSLKVDVEDLSWLKNVLTEGETKLAYSDTWTFILSNYAAQTLSISWKFKNLPLLEEISIYELALLKWLCSFEQSLAKFFALNDIEISLDKALLERCLTMPNIFVQDNSRASVLYLSLHKNVTQVFQSSWEQYSQIGCSPKENIKLIKSIGHSFHLASQLLQSQNDSKSSVETIENYDIIDINELLNTLFQILDDTKSLVTLFANAKEVISQKSSNHIINNRIMIAGNTILQNSDVYMDSYVNQGGTMSTSPKKVSNNDLKGAQFAGGFVDAENVQAQQIGGNINNYTPEQRQTLIEAAKEIQQLLQHLDQSYPTNTPIEKQVVVIEALKQIDSNPTLKARLMGAFKAGSTEAIKELVNHPLANVLVAALEGWQEP